MDNKGLVDLLELRKLKNNADFRGKSAYCFIKDNKIIKVYASKNDKGFIPLDRNSICDFSKYEADTIVFPNEYIYEKGIKAGEIQKYINKESITKSLNDTTNVDLLINNFELVVSDIMTYSNVLMRDLCKVNILYSESDGFHIIDTTEWELNKFDNYFDNVGRLSLHVIRCILDYIDLSEINYYNYPMIDRRIKEFSDKFGKVGQDFYKVLFSTFHDKYNFYRFMYAYQTLYQKYYGEELKTLNDMKEFTKVIKKG